MHCKKRIWNRRFYWSVFSGIWSEYGYLFTQWWRHELGVRVLSSWPRIDEGCEFDPNHVSVYDLQALKPSPWAYHQNWTYIRRLYDMYDVKWTSYVHSFQVMQNCSQDSRKHLKWRALQTIVNSFYPLTFALKLSILDISCSPGYTSVKCRLGHITFVNYLWLHNVVLC